MDRRDTIKTLLVGGLAGGTIASTQSCKTDEALIPEVPQFKYGQTPAERERDKKLLEAEYFTDLELTDLATLCDIILPATPTAGSASEADVPDFIEFMVKDAPFLQLPIRGGLAWINNEARKRFEKTFEDITPAQRIEIIEDIAYPDKATPEMNQGAKFFDRLRGLVLTGYYTSKIGIDDLGYVGNRANVWDGVPPEVLKNHDVDYDPEWIAKCINQEKRMEQVEWDDQGNVLNN